MSPYLKFVPIKYGFVRIYWVGGGEPAYFHEVWKHMPYKGYNIEEKDVRFQSKQYYQEYEDQAELSMKIKNFVEGYWDSMKTMEKRIYMFKNNKEYNKEARKAYQKIRVR